MTAEEADQLTESADLLPEVQSVPLVGDGLQHLLQGAVQLSVLLLRWPDSLTQTGEGRHLRAGIMTVQANSYRRRHRFTVANRRLKAAQEQEEAPETNPVYGGVGDPPAAGAGLLCGSTPRREQVGRVAAGTLVLLLCGSAGNTPHTSCNNTRLLKGQSTQNVLPFTASADRCYEEFCHPAHSATSS